MKHENDAKVGRRDFLRVLGIGAGAAMTPAVVATESFAQAESNDEKRKARYQADSPDVKAFYRVNGYPKK